MPDLPGQVPANGDGACAAAAGGNVADSKNGSTLPSEQKEVFKPKPVKWWQHPNSEDGVPTTIRTEIYLYHIGDMNTVEGTLYIEVHVQMNWVDPRLVWWDGEAGDLPENIWTPHFRIRQEKEVVSDVMELRRLDAYAAEGECKPFEVTKKTCFSGKIYNRITHLHLFPFDFDTVVITMDGGYCVAGINGPPNRSLKNSHRNVINHWGDEPAVCIRYNDAFMGEWTALAGQVDYIELDNSYDLLQVSISLSRSPKYHLNTVVVPLVLLSVFNILGHAMPVKELPDRLTYQGTLVVAVMALLFVVTDDLPTITERTIIDKLINGNLGLMALSGVQCVVEDRVHLHNTDNGGGDDTSTFPDWYAYLVMVIYTLIYVILYGKLLLSGKLAQNRNRKKLIKQAGLYEDNPKLIPGKAYKKQEDLANSLSLTDHVKKINENPEEYGVPGWLKRFKPQQVPG